MSEERFFPENVQRDMTKKDVPEKDVTVRSGGNRKDVPKSAAPVRHKAGRKGGQKLLLWGMVVLLVGFAFPLLLVFLVKWPHPGQHLLIFGISYYKLLFIYFLTSALLIHASFFFVAGKTAGGYGVFHSVPLLLFPLYFGAQNQPDTISGHYRHPFFFTTGRFSSTPHM